MTTGLSNSPSARAATANHLQPPFTGIGSFGLSVWAAVLAHLPVGDGAIGLGQL